MDPESKPTVPTTTDLARRLEVVESIVRSQGARLAQFEDAVSVYGPPKRRGLPIPEITREQRTTLVLVAVLMFLAVLPVLVSKGRSPYVSPV